MEQHLKININLFSFNDRDGSNLYTLYFGPHVFKETVNLIYWNNHYAWIKSIERLLNCITNFHGKTYWCNRCLNYFTSKRSYDAHDRECPNEKPKTKTIRFTLPISRSLKESTKLTGSKQYLFRKLMHRTKAAQISKKSAYSRSQR